MLNRTDLTDKTFAMKKRIRVGFWNVRTLWETEKLKKVQTEMKKYNLDILGLSEARWTAFEELRLEDGSCFIYSGREEGEPHSRGVGILLSRRAKSSLMTWKSISDTIIVARFYTRVRPITVIQCYAPTEASEGDEKLNFYGCLSDIIRKVQKRDIIFLMGDFNAKLGSGNVGKELVMGKHGDGAINDNGERLAEICTDYDLLVGGNSVSTQDVSQRLDHEVAGTLSGSSECGWKLGQWGA